MSTPAWVYLNTWIEDNFESGYAPWWSASDFASAYTITDFNGDKCAALVNPAESDAFTNVLPAGTWLEDDVDFQVGIRLGATLAYSGGDNFAFISLFLDIDNAYLPSFILGWSYSYGTSTLNFMYRNPPGHGNPWGAGASVTLSSSPYDLIPIRIKRAGDTISAWYYDGSWIQIGTDVTCSGSNKITAQAQARHTSENGPGFSYFHYQADVGFPPVTPPVARFTVTPLLGFPGDTISFDGSDSSDAYSYLWYLDDGGAMSASLSPTTTHKYISHGLKVPSLTVYDITSASPDVTDFSAILNINPFPEIFYTGIPQINETLTFSDASGPYYTGVSAVEFDYGAGDVSVSSVSPTHLFTTSYSAVGAYSVELSAYDVSGHVASTTRTINILEGNTTKTKSDYITLCGPGTRRFGGCRDINLTEFLPDYLKETDIYDFTKFFEDFLNSLYSGLCGFTITNTLISGNSSKLKFEVPTQNLDTDPRISILEKVKRIAELHDPESIDIEYIQYFAKYLGYNIEISRDEVGGFGTFGVESIVCSASDTERYLRFMVGNLPNWYKIKTTRDTIRILLYSFGLISDIATYYTENYNPDFTKWKPDITDDLANIPDTWYPTPHYSVKIDIDQSMSQTIPAGESLLGLLIKQGDRIIKAVESVRPVNDVFHKLMGYTTEDMDIYIGANSRFRRYMRIDSDGASDEWNNNILPSPVIASYIVPDPTVYIPEGYIAPDFLSEKYGTLTECFITSDLSMISATEEPSSQSLDTSIITTDVSLRNVYIKNVCKIKEEGWSIISGHPAYWGISIDDQSNIGRHSGAYCMGVFAGYMMFTCSKENDELLNFFDSMQGIPITITSTVTIGPELGGNSASVACHIDVVRDSDSYVYGTLDRTFTKTDFPQTGKIYFLGHHRSGGGYTCYSHWVYQEISPS